MKKILLLLALVMTAGAVNAKTDKFACNVTFPDNKSANCEYNTSTKTFSWSQANSNSMRILKELKGNVVLSKYKWLNVKVKNLTSNFRIFIYCDNNGSTTSYNETFTGDVRIDLTSITLTTSGHTYANINNINIAGSGSTSTGSLNIEEADVYLETDEYENMEIISTLNSSTTLTSPFQWYTSSDGTTKTNATGSFSRKQFETAGIKEILALAGSNLGYGNGFFDITGYDNVTVNIDSYDNTKDSQLRLLQATGSSSTTNFDIDVTKAGATTKSLSTLSTRWIAGVYTKSGFSNSQAITSIAFSKDFKATSTTAFNIAASSSSTVNYDRAFTEGEKYTICLPFALTKTEVSAAGDFYELSSVSDDVLNFNKVTDTETEAYKPYIFVPKTTGTPFASLTNKAILATPAAPSGYATPAGSYTFQGVLAATENVMGDNPGCYVYGFSAKDGSFVKVTGNSISVKAFRAYITVSTTAGAGAGARGFMKASFGGGDGTTAIKKVETVSDDDPNAPVYNLAGQQVDASYKGIVIKNGKKYFQNK